MRCLILLLAITLAYAEDRPVPQPIEVQRAMADYDRNIYNARKVYDAATAKISDETVINLEKAKKDYMSKGDLEGATLVQAAIKKIKDGDALAATEEKIKAASVTNLLKPTSPIVGKWQLVGTPFVNEFSENGTCLSPADKNTGKWTINGNKIVVVWAGGVIQTYTLPIKNNSISGTTNQGGMCTLTKLP